MRRTPKKQPACGRCGGPIRSVAEIAAELREFPAFWRCIGVEGWAAHGRVLADRPYLEDLAEATGASQLAFVADDGLPALALELEGKCCRWCALDVARERVGQQLLVYVGVLASFVSSGRDERAEEEFQLQAVAA